MTMYFSLLTFDAEAGMRPPDWRCNFEMSENETITLTCLTGRSWGLDSWAYP